jgi:HAD superfamily hydrolase (TIGR01459 family)
MHPDHPAGPAIVAGLASLAPRYDGFILDLWGVLHDGLRPYPGAVDALAALKREGKRVVILSNAPRRADAVIERITEIGIPPDSYDRVLSSGEEAWQHLKRRDDPFYRGLGRRCYHIGPPRDHNMLQGLDLDVVRRLDEAEFILNTGPWGWEETVENYEARLVEARDLGLPMICANPDLVVMAGERHMICAGTLAERYERLGGRVRWHGKPYASVYDTCFGYLGIADRRRILAVGDSLRTDIAGAGAAGIDSILVAGGIHAEEFGLTQAELPDRPRLEAAIAASGHRPTAVMARFTW